MIDEAKVERLRHLTTSIQQAQTEIDILWRGLKQDVGEYIIARTCNPLVCDYHTQHEQFEIGTQRHGYLRHGSWDWDVRPPRRQEYRSLDLYNNQPPRAFAIRYGAIIVHTGIYELVASQPIGRSTEHVFVRVAEPFDLTELEHQRATQNVRARAKRQGMRIRVRDRDITLIDPMNTEVLTGGVVEVSAWLLGLDIKEGSA